MNIISNLLEFSMINLFVGIIVYMIVTWFLKLFNVLFEVVFAKPFDLKVYYIQFFTTRINFELDGSRKKTKAKFYYFPTCYMGPHPGQELNMVKDRIYAAICFIVPALIDLGICLVFFFERDALKDLPGIAIAAILGFVIALLFHAVLSIFVCLISILFSGSKSLQNFSNQKARELRNSTDASQVDMPPLESLGNLKGFESGRVHYQNVRFLWAEMRRDGEALSDIARWFKNNDMSQAQPGLGGSPIRKAVNRNLVLYYSIWNINPDYARQYYRPYEGEFDSDDDINGYRLRAYYTMNILGDSAKALELARAGLQKTNDPRFSKIEIDHETTLLNELITFITNTGAQLLQ